MDGDWGKGGVPGCGEAWRGDGPGKNLDLGYLAVGGWERIMATCDH